MAFKKVLQRLSGPVDELDEASSGDCSRPIQGGVTIAEAAPRVEVTVVGEIKSVRVVPRPDGSPWLEATIDDGTGSLVVVWTGRKKIAGVRPGQRVVITGRGAPNGPGGRLQIYNPRYELRA